MQNGCDARQRYRIGARWVSALMIAATLLLIYAFSQESGATSSARSEKIARWLARVSVPGYAQMNWQQQQEVVEALHTPIRKAAHMAEFAFIGCWLCVFLRTLGLRNLRGAAWALAGSSVFAALDEWHQMFVGGRGPSIGDVGIDFMGALIGIAIAAALLPRFSRRAAGDGGSGAVKQ